jgi:hypothetical protein
VFVELSLVWGIGDFWMEGLRGNGMRGDVRVVFTRNSGVGEPLNPFFWCLCLCLR